MAKILELEFNTVYGKTARISLENPKEPIDQVVVKQSMDAIVASGVFTTSNGDLASAKGARVIDRNVTEYELV